MQLDDIRDYCLRKPGTTEGTPFGPDTLVFKVGSKMFALASLEDFQFINLKCDPERTAQLRERYQAVKPGYHMNKKLWNSVYVDELGDDRLLCELIDHSYELIVKGLPKKIQNEIQ